MAGMETSLTEVVGLGLMVFGILLFTVSLAGMLGFLPPPRWGRGSGDTRGDRA